MDSRPLTSLVIEPSYAIGRRYRFTRWLPDPSALLARSNARTEILDQILDDHDAVPEWEPPRWEAPNFFRLDQMTRAQQLNRLYDARTPFLTERWTAETYEGTFRAPSPVTADPEVPYPSRFEAGPADGDTTITPMVEFLFVDTFSAPGPPPWSDRPNVPVVTRPARYQFRGYDVLNRQAVYRYSGEGA